jgi:hypothetical protein
MYFNRENNSQLFRFVCSVDIEGEIEISMVGVVQYYF